MLKTQKIPQSNAGFLVGENQFILFFVANINLVETYFEENIEEFKKKEAVSVDEFSLKKDLFQKLSQLILRPKNGLSQTNLTHMSDQGLKLTHF